MDQDLQKIRIFEMNADQPLARGLILLFQRFEKELLNQLNKIKEFESITATDHQIFRYIRPEGSSIVEIAQVNGISKQAVSRSVASLEKRGFLSRKNSEKDGRYQIIQFSPKGYRLLERAIEIIKQIEKKYQDQIGERELAKIKFNLGELLKC